MVLYIHSPISQSFVNGPREKHVQQETLHDHQSHDTPGKPEPVQVVLQEHGGGADLDRVRVVGRVLEEAVVRIEDLAREKKEEFS